MWLKRARQAATLRDVIVATDDQRIVDALRPFGTRCVMTSPRHVSGTDRIAEVAANLGENWGESIIVNIQGDEPEIEPETIDALVSRLEASGDMATAATPFGPGMNPADPNLVKVVVSLDGKAIYFSRSVIPFLREPTGDVRPAYYLHQGIYAYRREFLLQLAAWPSTPLEQAEKLEQLRVLEHGRSIDVVITQRVVHGIDTPEQYQEFVKRFKGVASCC